VRRRQRRRPRPREQQRARRHARLLVPAEGQLRAAFQYPVAVDCAGHQLHVHQEDVEDSAEKGHQVAEVAAALVAQVELAEHGGGGAVVRQGVEREHGERGGALGRRRRKDPRGGGEGGGGRREGRAATALAAAASANPHRRVRPSSSSPISRLIKVIIVPQRHDRHAQHGRRGGHVQQQRGLAQQPQRPLDQAGQPAVQSVDRPPEQAAERPPQALPLVAQPREGEHEGPGGRDDHVQGGPPEGAGLRRRAKAWAEPLGHRRSQRRRRRLLGRRRRLLVLFLLMVLAPAPLAAAAAASESKGRGHAGLQGGALLGQGRCRRQGRQLF